MFSGLYAVASLDGAPIDACDMDILGLGGEADTLHTASGLRLRAVDAELGGSAASYARTGTSTLAFVGHFNEPEDLAARLGMDAPASAAHMALEALRRWGDDAMPYMEGEWSLLQWDDASRTLRLGVSPTLRDRVRFATDGKRVAVAPDIFTLARLAWAGRQFDPMGFPLSAAWPSLRDPLMGERTIFRHCMAVEPGTFRSFRLNHQSASTPWLLEAPNAIWQGSFEEAAAEVEKTVRRIVRQILQRHGTIAVTLSGGLDSSLLAWLAAEERRPGQSVFCITSVAPEGSGLADERSFAKTVADHLGLPITFVCPPPDADAFRPGPYAGIYAEGPSLSVRHYLYDTFYAAARAGGADAVLDGCFGEMSITRPVFYADMKTRWREFKRKTKLALQYRCYLGETWPDAGFLMRLSKQALDNLPPAILGGERSRGDIPLLAKNQMLGVEPWYRNADAQPTTPFLAGTEARGLRVLLPFRDWRLLRAMAPLPAHFMQQNGYHRAMARTLLQGRVPDSIRLRTSRLPCSPDYTQRLMRQAAAIEGRMSTYREAGAGEWVDLQWLSGKAQALAKGGASTIVETTKIQLTAMMAEFLTALSSS